MKKLLVLVLSLMLICSTFMLSACTTRSLAGFDIELCEALAKELGVEVEFKEINWDNKESDLENDRIDAVWNGFTYTEDRDNGYFDADRNAQIGGLDFSKFYMENKQVAVIKIENASTITNNEQMAGKRFCAEAGSAGESLVSSIFNVKSASLERQLDVFTGVLAGTYDIGVIDSSMASQYIQAEYAQYKDSLKVVDIEGAEKEYYAIGFKTGSNLVGVFNYTLAKLYANGTAKAIADKYSLGATLYNGFSEIDTANYTLPTDGAWKAVQDKGKIVIGYTIFAPMAYLKIN